MTEGVSLECLGVVEWVLLTRSSLAQMKPWIRSSPSSMSEGEGARLPVVAVRVVVAEVGVEVEGEGVDGLKGGPLGLFAGFLGFGGCAGCDGCSCCCWWWGEVEESTGDGCGVCASGCWSRHFPSLCLRQLALCLQRMVCVWTCK